MEYTDLTSHNAMSLDNHDYDLKVKRINDFNITFSSDYRIPIAYFEEVILFGWYYYSRYRKRRRISFMERTNVWSRKHCFEELHWSRYINCTYSIIVFIDNGLTFVYVIIMKMCKHTGHELPWTVMAVTLFNYFNIYTCLTTA